MNRRSCFSLLLLSAVAATAIAEDTSAPPAATQPAAVDASDRQALNNSRGKEAIVQGIVSDAAWSSTGKVMNIRFEKTEESEFVAVVFQRNKAEFDTVFNGSLAKSLAPGTRIRITGKVGVYRDNLQIVLTKPSQLVIEKEVARKADAPDTKKNEKAS